jgi:hypothetical protein
MKHTISMRWLADLNRGCNNFSYIMGARINMLFIVKVKILVLVIRSSRVPPPPLLNYVECGG